MKGFFFIPVVIFSGISYHPPIHFPVECLKDSTIIIHQLDGNVVEWPVEKFITDKETKTRFATDNNDQFLFLALAIPDVPTQKKIMQSGINLYVDIKGKKKESQGIEYPVAGNPGSMRLFGFSDSEPVTLSTNSEGTVNIAFAWDSSNVLHIEYNIPLKLLEKTISGLNNKKISVGWKLNESEMNNAFTTSQITPVPSGGRNRAAAPTRTSSDFPQSTTIKYKSFWTSHTIIF
jgi:hypothetical protein